MTAQLLAFPDCPIVPTTHDVLLVQNRLWTSSLVRAAGAMDVIIAAYALLNDTTVLHYDTDFEHIASAVPEMKHRWIVPRGSVGS